MAGTYPLAGMTRWTAVSTASLESWTRRLPVWRVSMLTEAVGAAMAKAARRGVRRAVSCILIVVFGGGEDRGAEAVEGCSEDDAKGQVIMICWLYTLLLMVWIQIVLL
jgi:hypothetical protein